MCTETDKLIRTLRQLGFEATKAGNGHWRIVHEQMTGPVFAAATPRSSWRAQRKLLATLRRKLADPSFV